MKKLIIMTALGIAGLSINTAKAQFGIHINLHLGSRPVYTPAVVEQQPVYNDDYYYLPDVGAYYSVGEQCYYYQDGNRWVSAAYLPGRYHDFDWRYAKHYEIHADRPYMRNDVYRSRFGSYAIRDGYYARAYPNSDRYDNGYHDGDRSDNRGWNDRNRGGFDRRDDRNPNAYDQPSQGYNNQGYDQHNQGAYNQHSQGQGSYNANNQHSQGEGQQQGSRGNGQGQTQGTGNSQPVNRTGSQNNSNYSGDHYAANKMGVIQDRAGFARPVRN